ncbi:hypothetical protein [Streptomyces sp.]|uniref:hypothetical protein n=1 Tax=Streptomyces sp. TaxID=1931 RepID=UPI0028119C87|nr:hypothetical protein [Streptomyces sp.]
MTTTGRRALLAAGAATGASAVLAGCTSGDGGARRASAERARAERVARAEAALRQRSVTTARTLVERYDATLAAHPPLAARLGPLRASAAAHVKALGEGGTGARPATATPTAPASSPTAPAVAATAAPAPVPADPAAALGELASAARRAADAHAAALLTAPPEYARLLASVAAAGAAHAFLLTEGARP